MTVYPPMSDPGYVEWHRHQTMLGRAHAPDNWPVCSDECPAGGDHSFVTDDSLHIGARWPAPDRWYCAECGASPLARDPWGDMP